MARKTHKGAHKYHKVALKYRSVWACGLPGCSHFMPPDMTELVVGKASICWNCSKEFVLDEESMKNDKPICGDCSGSKIKIDEFLKELGV